MRIFENSEKKARNQAENMGPIASVGMVVAINTSDSTFGWYGKRQGFRYKCSSLIGRWTKRLSQSETEIWNQ